jgi:hypothetical protein
MGSTTCTVRDEGVKGIADFEVRAKEMLAKHLGWELTAQLLQ